MELPHLSEALNEVKTEVQGLRKDLTELHTKNAVMDSLINGERGLGRSVDKLAVVIDELRTSITKLETKDATRASVWGLIAGSAASFIISIFLKIFHI